MKAILHFEYGSPDVLTVEEIDRPAVGDGDVLLRVRAASVNPLDWHTVRGLPYPLRMGNGWSRPKHRIPGVDVSGVVETVGKDVTQFRPGDEVFGVCKSAFAEYACAAENRLVPKPSRLTFEQSAAIPVAGLTALQALRDRGQAQPGQKVLIVGASGGVGTLAVQIAKSLATTVTGVCSTKNVDLVRSLGADHVIDYTQRDYPSCGEHYDLIVDMAGTHSLWTCRRALTSRGTYVVVGAPSGRWIHGPDRFVKALLISLVVSQKMRPFVSNANKKDLLLLKDLIESGKVTPVVDRSYSLKDAAEAVRYLEAGHARGKVVISVN